MIGASETRRLTTDPAFEGLPAWSPDGRQIAFLRFELGEASGTVHVVSPVGGAARRVSDFRAHPWARPVPGHAAFLAGESKDGRWLFYTKRDPTSPRFSLALPSGPERQVADCVRSRSFDVGPEGVYYAACAPGRAEIPLYRYDPRNGQRRLLGGVSKSRGPVLSLAVSPDGKTILFAQAALLGADLMLVENFR